MNLVPELIVACSCWWIHNLARQALQLLASMHARCCTMLQTNMTRQVPLQEDGRIAAQLMITFEWSDWCTPFPSTVIMAFGMLTCDIAGVVAVPPASTPIPHAEEQRSWQEC